MYQTLYIAIISVFIGLLFLNFYFRVKVLKIYKYLVTNRVDFSIKYFLDEPKLLAEIKERNPTHEKEILEFVRLVRRSITMASLLIIVIFLLGYTLMKFR